MTHVLLITSRRMLTTSLCAAQALAKAYDFTPSGAITSAAAEPELEALDYEALCEEVVEAGKDISMQLLSLPDVVVPHALAGQEQCTTAMNTLGEWSAEGCTADVCMCRRCRLVRRCYAMSLNCQRSV
jgi:hypothetical protein